MAAKVVPEVPDEGAVWSAQDTTPSAIEEALRKLLQQQHARDHAHAPARVLNLVVVVDREWRGEILNRLEQVGRYHASRTILCTVERGPHHARRVGGDDDRGRAAAGDLALTRERVIVDVGEKHLAKLDTIVDPLVVTDLPTVVWSPHGHPEAVDALLHLVAGGADRLRERARPAPARSGGPRSSSQRGVRGRPRLAAHHAVARARGRDLRPAALARGARPHRLRDGPAPS